MALDEFRFIGKVCEYNPVTHKVTLQLDFVTPEQQEELEKSLVEEDVITFSFSRPFRRSKTYQQLRKYFALLKQILIKVGTYPSADAIRSFDMEIKKTFLSCRMLEIYGKAVPMIPSKANMSVDEMGHLIEMVEDHYRELLQ